MTPQEYKDPRDRTDIEAGSDGGNAPTDESKGPATHPHYVACLIIIAGLIVSCAFIFVGVRGERREEKLRFERQASEIVQAIGSTWNDYILAALWVHEACRPSPGDAKNGEMSFNMCSRDEFHQLYDYLGASGLEFRAVAFAPNVTQVQREQLEEASYEYYSTNHPEFAYNGFTGFEPDPNAPGGVSVRQRSKQPFYFPLYLMEPEEGNEDLIEIDVYSSPHRYLIDGAVASFLPVATPPIPSFGTDTAYVTIFHPGLDLSDDDSEDNKSKAISSVYVSFDALIKRAMAGNSDTSSIYIYDASGNPTYPTRFYGGASCPHGCDSSYQFRNHVDLDLLRSSSSSKFEEVIPIEQREWTVIIIDETGAYEPSHTFVILGGVVIFVAAVCLALWALSRMRRAKMIAEIKEVAQAEKASLLWKAARNERELNEYLSHEVRNPLSAAISACTFLSTAHQESSAATFSSEGETKKEQVKEDIHVIKSSLDFIDDLLRSMLDSHKVSDGQLKLEIAPADLLLDVLEPVQSILSRRDEHFDFIVQCPQNLVVNIDRMRVKQIVLNLSSNSKKFVQEGFIRLNTQIVDDSVQILVEDSGPGIPIQHRSSLFKRFQESLDRLNQGTGMGLNLCKRLIDLMGGEIYLDESYDSGVKGCPGTRFVIDLKTPPVDIEPSELDKYESKLIPSSHDSRNERDGNTSTQQPASSDAQSEPTLPDGVSVLVVDDDMVLRKLITRSLKRVAPTWKLHEASNGETALRLVESNSYDLILMDQYMASVEKQLLGTETTFALRAQGCKSRICGLSANDMREAFLQNGADKFLLKPIPCEKNALRDILADLVEGLEAAQPLSESTEAKSE